jgi:hypothetical protein
MTESIKVRFTEESYKKLSQLLFEKINTMHKSLSEYQLILAVPVESAEGNGETVTTIQALEHISMLSFGISKLSTVLHSLEVSAGRIKPRKVVADFSLEVEKESLIMLREFLTELLAEQTQRVNDYMFKLQTIVQLGQTVDKVSSTKAIDEIRWAGALISDYSDLLSRIETALTVHFKAIQKQLTALN